MTATPIVPPTLPEQVRAHLVSGRSIVSDNLAAFRPVVVAELLTEHRSVIWLSIDASLAPQGSQHLDPREAIDDDILEQFEDPHCAADSAVVMDADALNTCSTSERLHLTAQANKANRFVRLHSK